MPCSFLVDWHPRRDLSYLKEITKEPVRQTLIAGSKGQELLLGGPGGYSVFTGRLIEILEATGDYVTANEIQAIIRERVYGDSIGMGHSQTPSFGSLSGTGDFVFIRNFDKKLPDNQIKLATVEHKPNGLQNNEKTTTNPTEPPKKKDVKPPTITITSPTVKRGLKIVEKDEVLLVAGRALDESGVESVTVNGKVANLDGNGNFSTEIPLKVGTNQVTVLAKDTRGNIGSEKFSVTRKQGEKTVAKAPLETSSSARSYFSANLSETGAYYALVIGNNNYRYLNKLKTAERDAVEVSRLLEGSYGFKTSLLLNASRKEIMDSMNNLRNRIGENDSLLIYYAGHGEYDRAADKAYWLPVDAQRDSDTEWIIADNITANIKRLTSRHVLVISDSCYSGSMNRSGETDLSAKGDYGEYLRKMLQRKSRTLLSSGGNEPVADGGAKGHSVFADALLRGLKEDENSSFTAQDLFNRHIRARVAGKSDQVPQYGFIRNSDDEGGDFVFIRRR